jgi:class 3 adenylate cyclase/tetratricopeptide (TPR) repeat protein
MQRCPNCGEDNPEKFRLCGYCGAQLSPAAVPPEDVRKTVTIVFCDLKDSTKLGEKLDSEALREVLNAYFGAMRHALERHGGTVEKYIGDAIMAVFGLPKLHEDDALRAVKAALEMNSALVDLNVRLLDTWGVSLQNRTGINTGEVVAGDVLTGQRLVSGDTVNVAARFEQAAPPGQVLIGEPTFRLVKDVVTVEPLEPLELKGKAERIPAYRVTGVSRGEAITRRIDLPVVGRNEEFSRLLDAFDRMVGTPRCEVVTVLGQAGLGKSRLIEEFARQVGDRAQVLRGRCLSYGEGITFWPLAEALRAAAGILLDDLREDAQAKLWALVGPGREDVASRVGSLMGISPGSSSKDELFWGARAVLETIADRKPLVLVFDDIHWAEPIFLDLVEHIADSSRGAPLLMLCAARHELLEERPGFLAGRQNADRIELRELSRADAALVLGNLTGDLRLPTRLQKRILSVADGNPLFVEQMISMLVDTGVIEENGEGNQFNGGDDDIVVPPTVSSLLASRLDHLVPTELGIIERAAVIGLDFQPAAVAALAPAGGGAADLAAPLSALCGKHLIRKADDGLSADDYRFNNLLLRDAAYDRLLKRTRARLHQRYADWLLEAYRSRLTEVEEIVGYHLEQSFRFRAELGPLDEEGRTLGDRAAGHLGAAGSRAFDREDMPAAANLLRRAADLLDAGHHDRPRLLLRAGDALAEVGELSAAGQTFEEARTGATLAGTDAIGREADLAALHLRYSTDAISADEDVVSRVRGMIPVLESAADHHSLTRAWKLLAQVHGTLSQFGAAAEASEQTIGHATRAGEERVARRFSHLRAVALLYGPTPADEALTHCKEVLVRVAEDRKTTAITEGMLAHLEAMRGDFETARTRYQRSRALLEEFGYRFYAALNSLYAADVEMLAGDLKAAERQLRRDYQALDDMGERNYISTTAGMLAEVLYRQGRFSEAAEFADVCRDIASADDVASVFLWRCVRAKLQARDGQHDQADAMLAEALAMIGDTDWLDAQGEGFMNLAEIRLLAGRISDAIAALDQAAERFAAKGNLVSVRRAADLAAELGRAPGPAASSMAEEP